MSETGKTLKTNSVEEAHNYLNMNAAKERLKKAPGKCKGYYIFDTETNQKYNKKKRIRFSEDVRLMLYNKADGRCELCGRKILYDKMTIDHIKPLKMGGTNDFENLQCTHKACNEFKGSILPELFEERIEEIFIYQMEKRYSGRIRWKIARNLMMEIL